MSLTRLFLSGIVLLALAQPTLAVEVTAEGQAAIFGGNVSSARGQALINAQRNAVEQG
ncbi:MAG: hypothetical protein IIA14_14425, partial [SAR324 cluster bacterium]|nr:hypothetical protein [SAR324 cluster bacterium]